MATEGWRAVVRDYIFCTLAEYYKKHDIAVEQHIAVHNKSAGDTGVTYYFLGDNGKLIHAIYCSVDDAEGGFVISEYPHISETSMYKVDIVGADGAGLLPDFSAVKATVSAIAEGYYKSESAGETLTERT